MIAGKKSVDEALNNGQKLAEAVAQEIPGPVTRSEELRQAQAHSGAAEPAEAQDHKRQLNADVNLSIGSGPSVDSSPHI